MAEPYTAMAMKRIQSELRDFHSSPPDGCCLESVPTDVTTWTVLMHGPDSNSIYAGKVYKLRIKFPPRYPLESPEVIFLSPTPVHPHIYSNGHICLDILYDGKDGAWSPALTINRVCLSLVSMLASNSEDSKPVGDEDYCKRVGNRSPKMSSWHFHDDRC